ncbi:hypothetical protein C6Y45_13075 [Alkalicoccus saliphilus]|uniref:Uncharacterized protein n=1 Tax=Alkalicoccus saliphilus TaxID=200989 RepID=A0A2T4U3Z2_9BACI|nr:hypothetical protein C6Y45_13075 [Alkalicoccus saliphilus]
MVKCIVIDLVKVVLYRHLRSSLSAFHDIDKGIRTTSFRKRSKIFKMFEKGSPVCIFRKKQFYEFLETDGGGGYVLWW